MAAKRQCTVMCEGIGSYSARADRHTELLSYSMYSKDQTLPAW